MLEIDIPGKGTLKLSHLVLDYNGTVACDGHLLPGVQERLALLSAYLDVHLLTADTFGSVKEEMSGINCRMAVIGKEDQALAKRNYIDTLGSGNCVCIGNGRNDRLMLKSAALGVAVVQAEGAALDAVLAADVVIGNIGDALDLLRFPLRLAATLRE